MKSVIISDTSPLNYLVLVEAVELLPKLFSGVLIPPAVADDLSRPRTPECVRRWFELSPAWLIQQAPQNTNSIYGLGLGETEAIALARELDIREFLADDLEARQVASQEGLIPIGTLAILEVASGHGWIDFEEYIGRLRSTSFRFREDLVSSARLRLKSKLS